MSIHMQTHINPNANATTAIFQGSQLNNQALQAERDGDLFRAESLHLEAIAIKENGVGPNAVSTALSRNALGELYIKLGRMDDAEVNLKKAVAVRNHEGPAFDAAVSRENLAQLYEIRGDLKLAKETRLYGAPDKLSCGHYHVCIFFYPCRVVG
jgi:tetratricopeptide (TPR) repeat protein